MATNPKYLRPPRIPKQKVLQYFAKTVPNVHCLQIGANDRKYNDPVYPFILAHRWRAILVEPQRKVFEEGLRKTYANVDHVTLVNKAISATPGHLEFYSLSFTSATWAGGLASFNKENILKHFRDGYIQRMHQADGATMPSDDWETLIRADRVETDNIQNLLTHNGFDRLDVFCCDTEGYDYEVLKLLDIGLYKPSIIYFESKHLNDNDYVAAKKLLTDQGYHLFWEKGDTIALSDAWYKDIPLWRHWIWRLESFLRKI